MRIAMLGAGFIGRFYADSIVGLRSRDTITSVYSRTEASARKFAEDYDVPFYTTDMEAAIKRKDVDMVCISLPNNLHLPAVLACAKYKKAVICTKPLGRNAKEGLQMLKAAEKAKIFAGYLEDLCYTPKFIKSLQSIRDGALGNVMWARSREAHPGPHSDWFWDRNQSGGGAILDLACHCVEISRNYIGKNVRPVEVMCWAATQVHPIEAEDSAVGLVKYANGAIGQFEVSWTFRGGMDLRDEVSGTEGTIWLNHWLRTGFDMFTSVGEGGYVAEKAEGSTGWMFPVGDEQGALGYVEMFADMVHEVAHLRRRQARRAARRQRGPGPAALADDAADARLADHPGRHLGLLWRLDRRSVARHCRCRADDPGADGADHRGDDGALRAERGADGVGRRLTRLALSSAHDSRSGADLARA